MQDRVISQDASGSCAWDGLWQSINPLIWWAKDFRWHGTRTAFFDPVIHPPARLSHVPTFLGLTFGNVSDLCNTPEACDISDICARFAQP